MVLFPTCPTPRRRLPWLESPLPRLGLALPAALDADALELAPRS